MTTDRPWSAHRPATVSPAGPPPITITSNVSRALMNVQSPFGVERYA
jgi:hypothetical protein